VGAQQEGKPLVLNVVRKAEEALVRDTSRNKEYSPIGGNPDVRQCRPLQCPYTT